MSDSPQRVEAEGEEDEGTTGQLFDTLLASVPEVGMELQEMSRESKIIVSTLPYDEKYKYLCSKRLDSSRVPCVQVEASFLSDLTSIQSLTSDILKKSHRKLTSSQWDIFFKMCNGRANRLVRES